MHLADGKLDLKNTFQSLEPTGAGCIAWHHDIFQNWGTAAPEQIRLCVPFFCVRYGVAGGGEGLSLGLNSFYVFIKSR